MERDKPYRPPFWESKKFGEPYGDFNRVAKPKAVVVVLQAPAGVRRHRPEGATRAARQRHDARQRQALHG